MAITNASKVPVGTVLEGKFRITRELGRGGMAAVYEAENIDIGKRVAVKILAAELITSRIVRERFIREARAAAAIRSPYICDVYDSGMYEDRPFLVMELLEGESLYDMMTRVRQLDAQTTLRIVTHSARGLGKAHDSNVVHRDLKPENIFLTTDEEGRLLAKIVDFGLAKFYEPTTPDAESVRLTREGALFGTPAYMSPEQAKGQGEVDHRADLWALGCITYECLTGQTVWNVEQGVAMILAQIAGSPLPKPSKLRPDLPPSFDEWFEHALDREPNRRFQTAREFADRLAEALFPKEGSSRPPPSLYVETDVLGSSPALQNVAVPLITPAASEAPRITPPAPEAPPPARDPVLDGPAAAPKSSSLRAVSVLMVIAALALGAYAAWLYVLHPPGKTLAPAESARAAPARPRRPAKAETVVTAVESEPYATKIAEAQELLVKDPKRALETFRAAFQSGGMPAARSLLSHATVAVEEAGTCRVTGLSRPRPFQIEVPVSRPTLALTSKGVVVSWVDNHVDPRRRQAFTVLLDATMRRITTPVSVTPEAQNVRQPQLVPAGDRLVLVYWDEGGREPGVYVRLLDPDGKIDTPTRRLSSARASDYPSIARAANGEFWAVWEEVFEASSSDVVARRLGPDLEPRGEPLRLTALRPPSGPARQPRTPDVAIAQEKLHIAFAKDLGGARVQVMLQSIALDDPALAKGLPASSPRRPKTRAKPADEFIGALRPLSSASSKNAQPHVTCNDDGCFVAWDDEKAGALVAFLDRERGPLWHREFAHKGARPALARDDRGVVVAFYEDARLKLAPVTREGVGKASVVSRVNGLQPYPDVARGEKPGQWYLAFRDYESAHLEIFALRADCP